MEHTKEPWEYFGQTTNRRGWLIDVAPLSPVQTKTGYVIAANIMDVNDARRIVDCVNALANIPDPAACVAAMGALATATQRLTALIYDAPLVAGVSGETAIEIDEAMEEAIAALTTARATMGEHAVLTNPPHAGKGE